MNPQVKLSICLFSDANFLAVNILENLLSKNCVVNIVTDNGGEWGKNTAQLSVNNKFSLIDKKMFGAGGHYDYAIFCGGFSESKTAYADYANFVSIPNIAEAKTVAIFPLELFDRNKVDLIKISNNTSVIFIGDLLGPRINLDNSLIISKALSEIIWDRKITLPVGEMFYPIFIADAVRTIVKWLFSFGPYGKIILLLGSQTSGDTFWNINQKLVGQLVLKYNQRASPRIIPKGVETATINSNLNFSLSETYRWLGKNRPEKSKHWVKRAENKTRAVPKQKTQAPSRVKKTIILVLIILGFPFMSLLLSAITLFIGYKNLLAGKNGMAVSSFLLARAFAVASEKESDVLGYIPGVGLIYNETKFAAGLAENINDAGIYFEPVITDGIQLFGKMLGTQVYNSDDLSLKLESEIAPIYFDALSMKNLTEDAVKNHVVLAGKILSRIDFDRFINLISQCKVLIRNAPQILGQDKSKTYLVLFQNNMELRPTGGFIGSFGLLTFDGGRLTDLTINDIYSADGQLNGHVEPPVPIKNYLGEANWWLRDSNWDPDFPTSAKRAEWFLDKEISKQVDGVVAVDLFPIKQMLKSMGPIFLSDYNLDVSSDNLYEKTQSEVDNNFFPGTHDKASFLTALARNLLGEVVKLDSTQELNVIKTLYDSLNGRHIQLYLHDNLQQGAVSTLGWDGSVTSPACGPSCYADLAGVVEANVGDNKANYYIQRSVDLNLAVSPSEIDRTLSLNLVNRANPALGPSGRYKDYIRFIIPEDASVVSVESVVGGTRVTLTPEITDVRGHKEVGVLVELLGGSAKSIEFSWKSNITKTSPFANYGIYFRKQAGTDADPFSINIKSIGLKFNPDLRFTLTGTGTYAYNTTLTRDLFSRFSW